MQAVQLRDVSEGLTAHRPQSSHTLSLEMPVGAIAERAPLADPQALMPGEGPTRALDLIRVESQHGRVPCNSPEKGHQQGHQGRLGIIETVT